MLSSQLASVLFGMMAVTQAEWRAYLDALF
jgi:hypothetical protein